MALAAPIAPEDAPIFLPYLGGGEQAALWDSTLRGTIIGLDLHHGAGHLARGLLNGIVIESRRCLTVLEDLGLPKSVIRVAGGGASSPEFLADLADATRRNVSVAGDGETDFSATGAALVAARAVGDVAGPARAHAAGVRPWFLEPDDHRVALWDTIAERYDEALAALRPFLAKEASR
jgi:sugar (pentulose or hexulose) kinase